MIKLENVSFNYENCAAGVFDINLIVRDGECVVLTGPSGGGKTTLTRLINGLAPAYYPGTLIGEIILQDEPLARMPHWSVGKQIGSVFQDPKSQFFSSELAGEVAFACENYNLPKGEIIARTDNAIRSFKLDGLRNRSLDVLSSGEKQRTAIASVYALHPGVYVCDEPTANLDNEGAAQLSEVFRKLKAEGNTLIIAEHRLSWLYGIADRYVYVQNGKILWEKTASEMLSLTETQRDEYGLREVAETPNPTMPSIQEDSALSIQVNGLSCKKKGTRIFTDISFSVFSGQITALTGSNGAGKTTLALALSGLCRTSGGSIKIDGVTRRIGQRRRLIWYSSNDTGTQFFTDSATEELLLNSDRSERRLEKARALLKRLDLYEHKDAHPATLSGGQKQRLSIACGILSDRKILIFDEPTSGLDGGNMRIIADVLRAEATTGKTVLVITHDRELMTCCCDCVINMEDIKGNGT